MEIDRVNREKLLGEKEHKQIEKRITTECTVAIEKTKFLQIKLLDCRKANETLTAALAYAEAENALLKSTR
jgi:hypothetical protein